MLALWKLLKVMVEFLEPHFSAHQPIRPLQHNPCQQGTHAFFSGHQTTMGLDMS